MSNVDSLDIAVGIPSHNGADNIEFVVHQVAAGLEKYFPDLNTVIINADNFSQDGTITNHLCYPLPYSVLGSDLRQPIGDFTFSGRLLEHWMRQDWGENVLQYGVDILMTSEAVLSGFSVAQVTLGSKIHKPSAPKLGKMFTQVVDTLFGQLSVSSWERNMQRPQAPPVIVYDKRLVEAPQSLSIDYQTLKQKALAAFAEHQALVCEILPRELASKIKAMFQRTTLRVSAAAWAEIVYLFLTAYAAQPDRDQQLRIVEALKPLYFARMVSFIWETLELDHVTSEKKLLQQAQTFWEHRSALLNRQSAVA